MPKKGYRHSGETRRKLREAALRRGGGGMLDKTHSEATKRKMSASAKGRTFSPETRAKMSAAKKGKPGNSRGYMPPEHKAKLIAIHTGSKRSEETKVLMKKQRQGMNAGEKNPAWKGGVSFDPYPTDWTDDLKDAIRKRDGYVCRECGISQMDAGRRHDVHHIDYDKENLNPFNLISLCQSCHGKTHHNRGYWTARFRAVMAPEANVRS